MCRQTLQGFNDDLQAKGGAPLHMSEGQLIQCYLLMLEN